MNPSASWLDVIPLATIVLIGTAVTAAATNWVTLGEWRRSVGQHWTERARALYRARATAALNAVLLILGALVLSAPGADRFFDSFPWALLGAALLGAIVGSYPLQRAVFPHQTVKSWIAALAIGLSVQAVTLGLFFVCLFSMPRNFGPKAWLIVGCWVGVQLAFELGLWLRFFRWVRLLLPPSERLARIVAEASARSGIAPRAVWESTSAASQAVAYITTRTLVFTSPLVRALTDAELESICLHELAHLSEPKSVTRLRVLAQFSRAPMLLAIPVGVRFGEAASFTLIALVIGFPFALVSMQRRMEQRADRLAATTTADPASYARALEKIHEMNQMPAVMGGRVKGVHPDLYDRMLAAGVTPSYPRPAKPKRRHWLSAVLAIVLVAAFLLVLFGTD